MSQTNGYYAYYPGCSLQHSAHAYDSSTRCVAEILGLTLQEIDDWNCCGATEYASISSLPAYSLIARNLALASSQGAKELVAPCSACYLNLRKTNTYMVKYKKQIGEPVNRALSAGGLHYEPGSLNVRHLLDVIVDDIGLEEIAAKVKHPLNGLRIAPYYGCLIVRPDTKYNPEYPTHLDELMRALGAAVVDFPLKTHCCGGHMTQISETTAYEMIRRLLDNADDYKADLIVTLCPMCQLNLDAYQPQVNRAFGTSYNLPVLFFTQLMGLAFGLEPKEIGLGSEIINSKPALANIGRDETPVDRKPARRDKKALPMPPMR